MGRRSPIRLGLALALVLVACQHTLATADKCRTGCHGASSKNFKFAPGTTYKYDFDGKIDVSLSSAEGQQTGTEVKAHVFLTQQGDCNQILRLQNVQVLGQGGKKFGQIPDIEKPIRLNSNDGQLEDSICVEDGDTQNAINIKRAIASMFQVNLKDNYETDVFGRCPTDTSSHKEGNLLVVQKSRNLNKCAFRENIKQDFLATTFNLNSEIKSSPILNADYSAQLEVKNGILESAVVHEHYLYVPFSVGKNGAHAQVVSKLKLTGTSKDNPKVSVNQAKSIIFENPHPVNAPKANVNAILTAVKETTKTIDVTVGESTAKEFVNLVKILRVSSKDDILAVYNQVKAGVGLGDKATAKKLFLDALLRAGNGNSVEVAIALLKNKEFNEVEQKIVYIGLSFVRHATIESLVSALDLLKTPNLPREAYLGIGNLAGRYCRQHSCEKQEAVNKLLNALSSKLGAKVNNRQDENNVIAVLKSIANVHYLNDNVLSKITTIAQDKKASNRLRVAALETYLADPCKDKLRDSALGILQDIQQDSEIRIRAYLVLAQCPNAKIGNAIKALLEKEPSYQVGGFIVSHIRNIRASANPDKELAKTHLGFINVPNRFPVDFRKWSYNGEFSYSVDTLGLASATEANIIYSQKSFLPRSTNLNLTTEIFGHTFNFLEIETRQENLDKLVEHYFGPKGVVRSSSLSELWKNNEKTATDVVDHLKSKLRETLRARRDVSKDEIESIGKQVQIHNNELNTDLDLDLSVKAFGSELIFLNLNDNAQKLTPEAIIDKIITQFAKGLDNIKHFEETLRSNLIFLDAEFAYPTSLGFPLRVALEGTSSILVKAKGSVDVRSLLNQKDNTIKVSIIPSANIEVAGRITLDALVVENGLKVVSTVHTATGGDLIVDIFNQGAGIDVKFAVPVKEQKLVSATHEIVFHTRELGAREENTPLKFAQNKDFSICLDQLSSFIGLTFCGEINGPNLSGKQVPVLPFPFAGDAKVAVTIEKDDLSQFHFRNLVTQDGAELNIETLGKDGNKKLGLQVVASVTPERFIKATLVSPIKAASAEARITSNNNEKSASLRLTNDAEEYFGKVGVKISGSPAKAIYQPLFEIKTPGGDQKLPYTVQGQIIVEQNGQNVKYVFDNVKAVISDQKTISLKGNLGRDGQAFFSDLTVSDGSQSGSLKGRLQVSPNLLKFNAEVQNTFNPNANFNIKGEFKKQPEHLDSSLQIIHGQDLSSKTNIITWTSSVVRKYKNAQDFEIGTKNKFSYPLLAVDGKFEYEQTPKSLDYKLEAKYNDIKLGSELDLKFNQKERGDYQLELDVWGLDNRAELKSSRAIHNEESKIANALTVNGKKIEVSGNIKHHVKPTNIDIGADVTIVIPTHNTPFKVHNGLKWNPNEIDVFQKIASGSNVLVDLFLKATKGGNANGSIKVNVKNILVVNGQLKANKGSGNGDILIDLQSIKRQVKGETTFTVQPPSTYNIELTLYPSFADDKKQKIVVSTHNKVSEANIDSKNLIDILDHKVEVNLKGSKVGEFANGKLNGELEVTLPGEQYLIGKINLDRKEVSNVINGAGQASLEIRKIKNAPGWKLTWKGQAKNTNPKEHALDLTHNWSIENGNGKNLNADLTLKNIKNGDKNTFNYESKFHGSVLKSPLEVTLVGHCQKLSGDYEARGSYGSNAVLAVKGAYSLQSGQPITGKIDIDLKSPSKILKTLKASASGSFKKPESASDAIELEGTGSIFADDDGTNPDAIVDLKTSGKLKASDAEGQVSYTVKCGKREPATLTLGYKRKEDGHNKEFNGNLAAQYGQKNVKGDVTLVKKQGHQYRLEANLDLPTETHKSNKLVVETKRSDDHKQVVSHVELTTDGKVWVGDSEFILSDLTPSMDMKVKCPEGKLTQILVKGNLVSDRQLSGELKLVCEQSNFLLEGNIDASVETADNFVIKANIHSPSLKLNKISLEAHNKPGKAGRGIQITVKSAGNNVLSGNANYAAREESGKFIVEGSGSFKVKEETQSSTFKYIFQRLTREKNGEQGVEISFDAALGSKAIDAEFKATNKQFRILNSYCEAKKECAHIEFDSRTTVNEVNAYNQELEINVDLRKLGLTHEFGLKAVTNRKEYVLDHTVDVHFQNNENSKYKYSLYIHPREAGLSLTTPKRIVALEANVNLPKSASFKEGGKASGEVAFYLDKKNNPGKKTSLSGWLQIDVNNHNINGESKFTHPGLTRPLTSSIKTTTTGTPTKGEYTVVAELDIFAEPNQKLVTTYSGSIDADPKTKYAVKQSVSIKSAGLGIDIGATEESHADRNALTADYILKVKYHVGKSKYENVVSNKVSKTQADILVKLLNVDLLKLNSKFNLNKQEQVVDTEVSTFNKKPIVSHLEVKNWNTLKYNIGYKNSPNKKLQWSSGLIPGQIADVRADLLDGSNKQNLFHATLKLDDANFLKSDYGIDSKLIEKVLKDAKNGVSDYAHDLKKLGKEWADDAGKEVSQINEIAKKATPNLKPIRDYYSSELKKLKTEVLDDKTIKELSEALKSILGSLTHAIAEITDKFSAFVESVVTAVQGSFAKITEIINKEIIPQIKEVAEKIFATVSDVANTVSEVVLSYAAKIAQIIEKFQPELKQVAAAIGELSQDFGRLALQIYEDGRAIFLEQWEKIYTELKTLPIFEELKAHYEQIMKNGVPNAEGLTNTIREVGNTLKDAIPADLPELKELIDTIVQYAGKKLKNEQVDDFAVLNKIIKTGAALVKRLLNIISADPNLDWQHGDLSFSLDFLSKLPRFVAVKFSPLSHLLKEESKGVLGFALSFFTKPRNWIPPFPLYGQVIQGQHIFTFDGKHLTFPGKCNYLLARDAVNGNFTIIGTYANGLLTAITLSDKHDSITVKKGGAVLLNNAATELPIRKPSHNPEISAYRDYEIINLRSTAGVKINCVPDLIGCTVSISGFYHGQLKGLLGNGNNEPYDDFTLPNGKIVSGEADFGNAYKTESKCAAVAVPEHAHHADKEECNKLFSWESSLRYCYPFVNTDNYKMACAHGLASGVKDTEVAIAKAYVAACNHRNIPIHVPSEFLECTNSEKPFKVGDKFSVSTPNKAADIVILVDTTKINEPVYKELVQPLVVEMNKLLRPSGINDVNVHVVTYGGDNQWPSHITVLGGKLTSKGKAPNLKFTEEPKKEKLESKLFENHENVVEHVRSLIHDLKLALGLNLQSQTYTEGLEYPFRANAVKTILAVTSRPCDVGVFLSLQKLRALLFKNNMIHLNLITPFNGLNVKDAKKTKDVVGFNDANVFTLSQGKKKPEGSSELYKELQYEDYCVDHTIKNKGNVFVSDNFLHAKSDGRKQFVQVTAHNIVNDLVNVEQGLDCECKIINPYKAQNVCHSVFIKEKARKSVARG